MASGAESDNNSFKLSAERIIEAEVSWASSLLLLLLTIYAIVKFDIVWSILGIASLSLYVLPIVTMRDPFKAPPWEMAVILALPMALHYSAGSRTLTENVGWWNDFSSLALAFSLATIGFLMTVELQMYTNVRMNRPFAVFFVIMFTLAAAGFWEIGLYIGDKIYGTHNQGTNSDVMTTLVWVLLGGVLMGLFYTIYLKAMSDRRKKHLGFVHVWEVASSRND